MKPESSTTSERFRNYHIGVGWREMSMGKGDDGGGFRRLLVYDGERGVLGWLDVLGESVRVVPGMLGALRERAARSDQLGHRWLVPVREIGEDDGLLYVVRDMAAGEEIAHYVGRLGHRLPLSDSVDLALEMAEIHEAFEGNPELAESLAWREALVAADDRHRLRLQLETLPSSCLRGGAKAVGAEGGSGGAAMRAVCDVLHFCLTGQWVAVDGRGQLRPSLGELPEEVRYLVWTLCQGRGGQGPESLAGVVGALGEIKARVRRQPVEGDRVPRCGLGWLLFGGGDLEAVFGRRFTRDGERASTRAMGTGAHAEPVVQQPFGYAMTLRRLPAASVFSDPEYARHLAAIGEGGGRGDAGALRVCARAVRGGVDYVVEENVNGASLEEIASMRGGFDPVEALELLGRVHATLTGLEARGQVPWSLSPANCLLHFEARVPRGGEGVLNENVACWPEFAMVLRLHPTMADLIEGRDHAAGACGFAALFWHLLAFGKRRGPLATDGTYRPLRRLRDAGNAFLRDTLSASCGGAGAAGRAAFLERARALAAEGAFDGPGDAPAPGPVCGTSASPVSLPDLSARALLRVPRRPVSARAGKRSMPARLARQAAILAGTLGLAVGCAYVLLPEARRAAVVRFEGLPKGPNPLPADGPAVPEAGRSLASADLVPVVLASPRTNVEERGESAGFPGCVQPFGDDPSEGGIAGEVELVEALLRSLRESGRAEWDSAGIAALRRAADAGSPTALLCLGDAFDVAGDPRAIDCYRESAVSGHPAGMRVYAECLLNGKGLAADASEAILWFRKAGEAGDTEASRWLSEFERVGATVGDARGR